MAAKLTRIAHLAEMKAAGRRIAMITAYDAPSARVADEAGVDVILVGDSLGNVVLGHENTIPVTVADMVHHTAAVSRAKPQALVVADMPFMSYHLSPEQALANAGRLIQEGGAHAVKIEGGGSGPVHVVQRLVDAGIPVMGHLGLTPQSIHQLSGYRVQGRAAEQQAALVAEAKALDEAGVFAIVLELITAETAAAITVAVRCPTIGIGSGGSVDGQVMVLHDMLGLSFSKPMRFVRQYAHLRETMTDAIRTYCEEVRDGKYPADEHAFHGD